MTTRTKMLPMTRRTRPTVAVDVTHSGNSWSYSSKEGYVRPLLMAFAGILIVGQSAFSAAPIQSPVASTGPSLTISSVQVSSITKSSARITYTTSVASTTLIRYGTSTSYGYMSGNPARPPGTYQDWFISGLAPSTTYHFCPLVTGSSNNTSPCDGNTNDYSFTTSAGSNTVEQPVLPQSSVDTAMPIVTGQTFNVAPDCTNLQAQLNAAAAADGSLTHQVILPAGLVCDSTYTAPAKSAGDGWIIVRTSTPDSQLPDDDTRITPAQRPLMATIRDVHFTAESGADQEPNISWYLPCQTGQYFWGAGANMGFDLKVCASDNNSWAPVAYTQGKGAPTGSCSAGSWYWDNTADTTSETSRDLGAWLCLIELNATVHYVHMDMMQNGGNAQMAALQVAPHASHYRFEGIEFTTIPLQIQSLMCWYRRI